MFWEKEEVNKFRIIELILIAATVLIMGLLISSSLVKEHVVHKSDEVTGWYYLDGEEKVEITFPVKVNVEEGQELILYHDTLASECPGYMLVTKGAQYDLKILCGDTVLYEYEEYDFVRNAQMKSKINCTAQLPLDAGQEVVTLHFTGNEDGVCRISQIYVGHGPEVMHHVWAEFSITVGTVTIMAVWGVIAIAVALFLRSRKMQDHRFVNVGCFLFLCGLWCLTDTPFVQEHIAYTSLVCEISFYAFMLMAVPMLYFLRNTAELKKYKIIDVLIVLFSLNAIVQGVLNYLDVFEFIEMLFVTHVLLISGVSIMVYILIKEYRKEKSKELQTILAAFAMLAASGVIALLLYWLFEISYYGNIYEFGILVFVIALICGLIITMADNVLYKVEMQVYQRMAKEDKLTGMGNRRAFDELIGLFSKHVNEYDDAALIFMDLNNLKKINDTYGHSVGDEVLIASANCIRTAFGEKGSCFRLGGDEFCAVLLNPSQTEEELFHVLDREIEKYNKNSKYRMSIARGMASIKTEDGTLRSISDWKYLADQKMYENKGWQRRE